MKKVARWIRVSTEDQVRGESPETHLKRAKSYAELKGWKVVKTYQLDAVSGKSVLKHPKTKKMLRDVKDGHITGLIFTKLARLARNTKELLQISDYFREHDADLISVQEAIDTPFPSGRLYYTIISAMAQWEREEIAERVAASVPIRTKMNKALRGAPAFGYSWVNQKLVINKEEAPIRQLMFELFVKYQHVRKVTTILHEKGYRTRKGASWSGTSVDRLLKDPIAKGLRRANYPKKLNGQKHWKLKPKEEWVLVPALAIVTKELWDQVQDIFLKQSQQRKPVNRLNRNLFGGIAVCYCGGKMYVPSNMPKYTCQNCRHKMHKDDLEAPYIEALKQELTSEKTYKDASREKQNLLQSLDKRFERLSKDEEKIGHEIDRLFDLHSEGQIQTSEFSTYHQPKKEQIKSIEEEMSKIKADIDYLKINTGDLMEVLETSIYLRDNWDTIDKDEKLELVRRCTSTITIGKEQITITLIREEYHHFHSMTKATHNDMGSCWQPT